MIDNRFDLVPERATAVAWLLIGLFLACQHHWAVAGAFWLASYITAIGCLAVENQRKSP